MFYYQNICDVEDFGGEIRMIYTSFDRKRLNRNDTRKSIFLVLRFFLRTSSHLSSLISRNIFDDYIVKSTGINRNGFNTIHFGYASWKKCSIDFAWNQNSNILNYFFVIKIVSIKFHFVKFDFPKYKNFRYKFFPPKVNFRKINSFQI